MMFPLVQDLAADGIKVSLAGWTWGLSPQSSRSAGAPAQTAAVDAHLLNAIDHHADDPEFGHRCS